MTKEEKEVSLDQPFGPSDSSAEKPKDEPETKATEEKVVDVVPPKEEPARVPYSRFENVNRARREAEEEAEKWRQRVQELEQTRQPAKDPNEVPLWWIKLYGEEPEKREAYKIWRENAEAGLEARAEQKAIEAIARAKNQEQATYRENLQTLDEHIETISDIAGHPLTEDEQEKILDIIDDYTAKDEDGNYAGALLPPDKAWELYELKQKLAKEPTKKSRDNVASIVSAQTSGQPTVEQQERDKNWRPWSTERYPQ